MFQNLQPVKSLINSPVIVTHENIDTVDNMSINFVDKEKNIKWISFICSHTFIIANNP